MSFGQSSWSKNLRRKHWPDLAKQFLAVFFCSVWIRSNWLHLIVFFSPFSVVFLALGVATANHLPWSDPLILCILLAHASWLWSLAGRPLAAVKLLFRCKQTGVFPFAPHTSAKWKSPSCSESCALLFVLLSCQLSAKTQQQLNQVSLHWKEKKTYCVVKVWPCECERSLCRLDKLFIHVLASESVVRQSVKMRDWWILGLLVLLRLVSSNQFPSVSPPPLLLVLPPPSRGTQIISDIPAHKRRFFTCELISQL